MEILVGVDVGNATTEAAVGRLESNGGVTFLGSSACRTTGTKGTPVNLEGILNAISVAARNSGVAETEIQRIVLNHATPVIGDFASISMDCVSKLFLIALIAQSIPQARGELSALRVISAKNGIS